MYLFIRVLRDINPQHKKAIDYKLQNVCNTASSSGHMMSEAFTTDQSECVIYFLKASVHIYIYMHV